MEIEMEKLVEMKEVRTHIEQLALRLQDEKDYLCDYVETDYAKWMKNVEFIESDLQRKGMEQSLPEFVAAFAKQRLAFLNDKKAYVERSLALIEEYIGQVDSSDIEKLTSMDAIMTSIATSLGFFGDKAFYGRWYEGENA